MNKFLAYLRNDKGGAVEWVLVSAGTGALIVAATSSPTVKNAMNGMWEGVLTSAKGKGTM